jgi:hypothetical protein
MRVDLMDLLRADTAAQHELESYGIDPTKVEEWLSDRKPAYADPTAWEAVRNADRDLARRRARA